MTWGSGQGQCWIGEFIASNHHIIVTLCLLRCGVCGGDGLSCGHLARHRASWSLGPLAPCSLTCGGGTQARVTCHVLCVTCYVSR